MYRIVEGSRGNAPRFSIICGLREGYGPAGKLHTADEVVTLVEDYLRGCAAAGRPFLTGIITTGTVVYAWPGGPGPGTARSDHEPQATYSGGKNPLYNSAMTAEQVADFLNDLGSRLGAAFGQTRIYVAYAGDMWILQREDVATPTGETVSLSCPYAGEDMDINEAVGDHCPHCGRGMHYTVKYGGQIFEHP